MNEIDVGRWHKTRRMKNGKPVARWVRYVPAPWDWLYWQSRRRPTEQQLKLTGIEREWGVRSRLRVLVGLRRAQEYRRWRPQALRAAIFPGILIPFRPNARAWWNQPEAMR